MRVASHRSAPLDARLRGNDVLGGTTKFAMLRSTPSESSACDVSTQAKLPCVVTTYNRDQEV